MRKSDDIPCGGGWRRVRQCVLARLITCPFYRDADLSSHCMQKGSLHRLHSADTNLDTTSVRKSHFLCPKLQFLPHYETNTMTQLEKVYLLIIIFIIDCVYNFIGT